MLDDYAPYADWFKFQDDLNGSINRDEKLITVFSSIESPEFLDNGRNNFRLNPEKSVANSSLTNFRVGAPIVTGKGEFSLDLPGEEYVGIYNRPISRIGEKDYYSILFFDNKGTEINRCGRSEVKWKEIAAGYFTKNKRGNGSSSYPCRSY